MKYILFILLLFTITLDAKGVRAGTLIKNQATMSFTIKKKRKTIKSNIVRSRVDQVVDVELSWMDASEVGVSAGEKKKVLTFKILNSGNYKDRFNLSKTIEAKSTFELSKTKIYVDKNHNYKFDPADTVRKTINLDEDESGFIFVVSNLSKKVDAKSGDRAYIELKAVSRKGGSGQRGHIYKRKGIKHTDLVDGVSGGVATSEGVYRYLKANVVLDKSVSQGSDGLISVVIAVKVEGRGVVKGVKVWDEIPNETKYIKSSLRLNGRRVSDRKDGDEGRYKRRYKNKKAKIIFKLGDMDSSSHYTIRYKVKIREE